jgi:MoxR-like ATPase
VDYTNDVRDITAEDRDRSKANGHTAPSGYVPDEGLVDAVNVALILGRPLLLTGDPGTGKTQLASSLAWQLAARKRLNVISEEVEKFETKSTSVSKDLFYTFDAIRRFQAARQADATSGGSDAHSNLPFITFNALGRALLRALKPEARPFPTPSGVLETEPCRTVVLIDEIDKAPRDFPNDVLNEIDEMYFRIPELDNALVGGRDAIGPDYKPIVVLTSNSERNLPDPFLRRCIYYHIPFPKEGRLKEILLSRLPSLSTARGRLVDEALAFFLRLRDSKLLTRRISAAELIEWLTYMLKRDIEPTSRLAAARDVAVAGLPAMIKDPRDFEPAREELERFLKGA